MQDEPIFEVCLISELIRPDVNQKANLFGFFGRTPHVTIKVHDPRQPLADLVLLFLSRPMPASTYRVGLSVKDPSGVVMFPMAEQSATQPNSGDTMSLGYTFRPFRLTGAGIYEVILMVNDKLDLRTSFTVVEAEPNELF
jgi:hypothetical protein